MILLKPYEPDAVVRSTLPRRHARTESLSANSALSRALVRKVQTFLRFLRFASVVASWSRHPTIEENNHEEMAARVDDAANGGNSDGIVCAKPLSAAEQAARFPNETVVIFDFRDNTLTPSH
jgi:hypothetical protein